VKHSIFVRLKLKGIRERKFLFPGISMGIRADGKQGNVTYRRRKALRRKTSPTLRWTDVET
jgi:hypothetical protein